MIARTIHSHDQWLRQPDAPSHNEEIALYYSPKDNYEEHSYDSEINQTYTLAMTLKPGEKFTRWTQAKLGKYAPNTSRSTPERYANAQLIWDLICAAWMRGLIWRFRIMATSPPKRGAAFMSPICRTVCTRGLRCSRCRSRALTRLSGARFSATLFKESESSQVAVYWNRYNWNKGDLHDYKQGTGAKQIELDLDANLAKLGATYNYAVGFALRGDAEAKPAAQAGISAFRAVTDLQVSPHSFPALALGKNVIRFRRDANGAGKVRITHRWREINDRHAPNPILASATDGIENPFAAVRRCNGARRQMPMRRTRLQTIK